MGLLAAFQPAHRGPVNVAFPVPKWDYDPRNISADATAWPNAGTQPGHGLVANGQVVVEPQGGPKALPCVSFPNGGFYDGTVELGIVGAAPRTHLVLFASASPDYIELMGWGYSGYYHMYDSMIYARSVIQHFWGDQAYAAGGALRPSGWNAWLVRAASRGASNLALDMWLNSGYSTETWKLDTGASALRIGSGHYQNYAGDRKIARVLIWDRALSDGEVAAVQSWVANTYGLDCGPAVGRANTYGYGSTGVNPALLNSYPA